VETWDVKSLELEPHFPQVLRSDSEGRMIVINLPAGEELQEHQVHERSWLVVVEGEVEVEAPGAGAVKGGPGLLVHAQPNERNEIRAISDARLVMVLLPWPGEGHPSSRAGARAEASE
jgi:quercetin dioxygenase-like cupin family protein